MITAAELKCNGLSSNMVAIEFHLNTIKNWLKKQKTRTAHEMAESIDWCLFALKVGLPECFREPCPDCVELPLFDENERKLDEYNAAHAKKRNRKQIKIQEEK